MLDLLEDHMRSRHPVSSEIGARVGEAIGRGMLRRKLEKQRSANLRRFNLKGRTQEAQYLELLRLAKDEGLLKRAQSDPRTQAVGFAKQPNGG